MTEKTLIFKKVTGEVIEDVEKYVKDWSKENPYGKVIVGCDAHAHSRRIKYAIAIVMHYIDRMGGGRGAHVIVAEIWEKRNSKNHMDEMTTKLWNEAQYTLMAAQMIDGNDEIFKKRMILHLDFSPDAKYKSNIMFSVGIGFLTSMGYKTVGKPDAYVATHTSDAFAR